MAELMERLFALLGKVLMACTGTLPIQLFSGTTRGHLGFWETLETLVCCFQTH